MQGNLDQHYNVVHGGLKPFVCNHCGLTYSKKYNLMIHLKSIENSCMKMNKRNLKLASKAAAKPCQENSPLSAHKKDVQFSCM